MGGGNDYNWSPDYYYTNQNGQHMTSHIDDGNPTMMHNPGNVDLAGANPALWGQIQDLQKLQGNYADFAKAYTDPARYATLTQEMQDKADTATTNRYARLGLSGSSVANAAGQEAQRQVMFGMQDRQMRDVGMVTQGQVGLNSAITGDIMKGQGEYGGYQQSAIDAYLKQQSNNQSFWNSVIGAGGSILGGVAGGLLGGPAGAFAGAGFGSKLLGGGGGGAPGGVNLGGTMDNYNLGDFNGGWNSPSFY